MLFPSLVYCISPSIFADDMDVDELKRELAKMKDILNKSMHVLDDNRKKKNHYVIDGNLMSTVFIITFFVIILVSIFSFRNLYIAVMKKYPHKHDEL